MASPNTESLNRIDELEKEVRRLKEEAGEMDLRRQGQIKNQTDVINRLQERLRGTEQELYGAKMTVVMLIRKAGGSVKFTKEELETAPTDAEIQSIEGHADSRVLRVL